MNRKIFISRMLILSFIISLIGGNTVFAAPAWTDDSGVSLESEAGIVIDAQSGTVIYGKNSKEQYFPASITKVMTALLVLENCSMDDIVTFSHDAVYNVESGSTNAGIDEGEQMTVKDCLYAMMLKSANEAANALAEHVSGSREAFADLMTARAKELGCENTSFKNPSGLNDPEHYTTASDFALIVQAAWKLEGFREIESQLTYKLPPTRNDPEGLTIRQEHKMMLESWGQYYDPEVKGGKTGYTILAGNTLTTVAERDGRTLIVVILKGSKPDHYTTYTDTRKLLDYGFDGFINYNPAQEETDLAGLFQELKGLGADLGEESKITIDTEGCITVPAGAAFSDAARSISTELAADAPFGAIARLDYTYEGRPVGSAYIKTEQNVSIVTEPENQGSEDSETDGTGWKGFPIPGMWIFIGAGVFAFAALAAGLIYMRNQQLKKEKQRREERIQARRRRMKEAGISMEEFERLLKERQDKQNKEKGL
ncbi:MAG: D-alanyl-D-alanine carboxypeptidase [Lachnospiraceae bacterium]|nr:D-alanyl-D-alanine carboxypeptidase [Lachnospiraceae bacterium]